jgi:hypothetical protein
MIRDVLEKIPPDHKVIVADTSEDQTPEICKSLGVEVLDVKDP